MDDLHLIIDMTNDLVTLNADDITRANYVVLRRAGHKVSTTRHYTQMEQRWAAFCTSLHLNPLNFEVV